MLILTRIVVPLLLLGTLEGPCLAQSPDAAPGPSGNPAPAASSASAPVKKIWTNENVADVKGRVSVVGKKDPNSPVTAGPPADAATVQRIRQNLEKLQTQLAEVNKKLKIYKEFAEGEPVSTGARDWNKGINRVPVDQQIVQLQNKKKQLEAQMGDLQDEARKKGIDPGLLR